MTRRASRAAIHDDTPGAISTEAEGLSGRGVVGELDLWSVRDALKVLGCGPLADFADWAWGEAMGARPSGTVTFLFTDIEGSTRRWEADPNTMRVELAAHDEVLRAAVEAHGGWLFKHTGDGVCAAFGSARAAVDAAIDAQRALALPVRIGVGTGEAELRGDDYFGPALNRAARVMGAGHGGQILVAATTAPLIEGVDLVDLGEHRLRDLSGVHRLFQVRAERLRATFPAVRALDAVPGNLPVQGTSFVGRQAEVAELVALVRAHRLVTLTGVGGVGKTRLAVQVAGELVPDFPEGVWLVELAPVGDPASVPDAVATALGVVQQPGLSVTASVAETLAGRHLLVVIDNCEHVIDAVADLVEAILARSTTVTVLATSREGLRVAAEQLWSVPSLGSRDGAEAVELFVERARAVQSGFTLDEPGVANAVAEICQRLDGIALAIELAAARMVSMSPVEVRDHLGDRFRLLAGSRRGLERHQTLRHAVAWSFDLLDDDERRLLCRCSVFAGGFDSTAAVAVCGGEDLDRFATLDLLDSLVRKSLVTAERVGDATRYGMLETIRQFAEEQLAATGRIDDLRDRHAHWFAHQAMTQWDRWDGPRQRDTLDWVEAELANLRAGFRWAADRADLVTATAIAAHTAWFAFMLQQWEPVGWAAELLDAATASDLVQLPRLYTAASFCMYTGRPDDAVISAETAVALEMDPRFEPFEPGWAGGVLATALLFAGQPERSVEIYADLATQPGLAHLFGMCGLLFGLPAIGRTAEAIAIADETLAVARARNNPIFVAYALNGYGRAFALTDPARALTVLRDGLAYSREHRLLLFDALIAQEVASLEAALGDPGQALELFDTTLESCQRAGDRANLATTLAHLAVFYDTTDRPVIAATLYGTAGQHGSVAPAPNIALAVDRLRATLGDAVFAGCIATGEAMEPADGVRYAREQVRLTRVQMQDPGR